MRISECENIRDAFYEPETIGTINEYEEYSNVMLRKLQNPKMNRINVYVKCRYVRNGCKTSEVVTKKIEIVYLNEWKDHSSYIDLITYWYDDYHKTRKVDSRKSMCDLAEEYISFRWNHKNVWKIVSVDNVKIERP